jgi:hypothetical protein
LVHFGFGSEPIICLGGSLTIGPGCRFLKRLQTLEKPAK